VAIITRRLGSSGRHDPPEQAPPEQILIGGVCMRKGAVVRTVAVHPGNLLESFLFGFSCSGGGPERVGFDAFSPTLDQQDVCRLPAFGTEHTCANSHMGILSWRAKLSSVILTWKLTGAA